MQIKDVNKVRAILIREDRIAVINARESGTFTLPGGKVDDGESNEQTLGREILEETGIEIEAKDINGPFFQTNLEYKKTDEQGQNIMKRVHTSFYLVNTKQDFNSTKIKLTPKEIERESKPYWVNPTKLEYYLTTKRDSFKSEYARRYAEEFLKVYNRYKQFQIKEKENDNLWTR